MVKRPKLKRMEASDWVGVRPRARRTCEGSGMPEVQAEPVGLEDGEQILLDLAESYHPSILATRTRRIN